MLFLFCNYSFRTYVKFSEKLTFLTPLIRTRTCACYWLRNISFSENIAYVLNGCSPVLCVRILERAEIKGDIGKQWFNPFQELLYNR